MPKQVRRHIPADNARSLEPPVSWALRMGVAAERLPSALGDQAVVIMSWDTKNAPVMLTNWIGRKQALLKSKAANRIGNA